jgi:hypothetical protein
MYIADRDNDRIVKINGMNGFGWTTFGTSGSGVGQFDNPVCVLPLSEAP